MNECFTFVRLITGEKGERWRLLEAYSKLINRSGVLGQVKNPKNQQRKNNIEAK